MPFNICCFNEAIKYASPPRECPRNGIPGVDVFVFSRKMTMSTSSGCLTGLGTPA